VEINTDGGFDGPLGWRLGEGGVGNNRGLGKTNRGKKGICSHEQEKKLEGRWGRILNRRNVPTEHEPMPLNRLEKGDKGAG